MGIFAFFYMWQSFGVVVLQRYMLVSRGIALHGYLCILLYVAVIWCSGVAEIYACKQGVALHGYLCILLYVAVIQCSGVAEIYACKQGGRSAMGISAFFYMWQ